MKAAVITWFVMLCLAGFSYASNLATKEYPRAERKTVGGDALGLIITLTLLAWAGWLLWGSK